MKQLKQCNSLPEPLTFDQINPVILSERIEDGIYTSEFKFNVFFFATGVATSFGSFSCPAKRDQRYPALLHIHGGGQTNDTPATIEWAREGYAAMSFDWTGPKEDRLPEHTMQSPSGYEKEIPLHGDGWKRYLGYIAARNCLTVLEQNQWVDPEHIGIYGISWGGFLVWLINGTDERVKCAVPIYGTGGLHRPGHIWNFCWNTLSNSERHNWLHMMCPEKYIYSQKSPVLHLSATNDFFGGLDTVSEIMPKLDHGMVDFVPNSNHHTGSGSIALMKQFFQYHLCGTGELPPVPRLQYRAEGNQLHITSTSGGERTELWISYGQQPHYSRYWKCLQGTAQPDEVQEFTVNASGTMWFFARKYYHSGISISSAPVCLDLPGKSNDVSQNIYTPGCIDGIGIWMHTDPREAGELNDFFELTENGLLIRAAENPPRLLIFIPPETQEQSKGKSRLVMSLQGTGSFTVDCCWRNMNEEIFFCCDTSMNGDGTRAFQPGEFRNDAEVPMGDFAKVEYLIITGRLQENEQILIKNIAWQADKGAE